MLQTPSRDYTPSGAARTLWHCRAGEVVLSGPAGTGKSLACLWKMHFLASKVPGFRGLIVRKTRESLTEAALVTFEQNVLPPGHILLDGPQRRLRQAYHYPNGSEIVIGGLDKPGKIMSTEYDCAYVQEAIELSEDAWESLTTRLRNGRLPYQQLMADTNPDRPTHWLRQRCTRGQCLMLESRHEDNPRLHDGAGWTEEGHKYVFGVLDNLTGPRKQRLRHGRWVQAEGVVYEEWDAAIHVIDRFPIPMGWTRYMAVDFGFTNPFVAQWWAEDPDGRLYLYREIYRTHRLVEDHARDILRVMGWPEDGTEPDGQGRTADPRPRYVVCDHDAEDRATLKRYLPYFAIRAAKKDVSPGIQAVAARLRKAGDGRPRLFVLRDSVVGRQEGLVTNGLVDEIEGYVWEPDPTKARGEEPVKLNDHSMDSMRYQVFYLDAPKGKVEVWG